MRRVLMLEFCMFGAIRFAVVVSCVLHVASCGLFVVVCCSLCVDG